MSTGYDINKIFEVVLAFNSEKHYDKLLNTILAKMMEITSSDAGTLYTVEDDKLHFRIIKNTSLGVSRSLEDVINLPAIRLDSANIQNISAYTAIHNKIAIIDDVYNSDQFNFEGPKNYDTMTGYRTQSMLTLPLANSLKDGKEEVIGVIQLINAVDNGRIVPYRNIYNPPIIPALAKIAANTLSNSMHLKEMTELFNSFVAAIMQAIDERSVYNNRHTYNVAKYCGSFARYLAENFPPGHPFHFDENRIEQLGMAALLHDIGKIVTPIEIMDKKHRLGNRLENIYSRFEIRRWQLEADLAKGFLSQQEHAKNLLELENAAASIEELNQAPFIDEQKLAVINKISKLEYISKDGKPSPLLLPEEIEALSIRMGTLTSKERTIMQDHVNTTGRMLDGISSWKNFRDVPQWAKDHHELLDGSGYPNGKKGSELSIETCLLTIVDIFEALSARDRPYKQPMPLEQSQEVLRNMASKGKLHPELVELFIKSQAWL